MPRSGIRTNRLLSASETDVFESMLCDLINDTLHTALIRPKDADTLVYSIRPKERGPSSQ